MSHPDIAGADVINFDYCRAFLVRYLRSRFQDVSNDDICDAVGDAFFLYFRSAPPDVHSSKDRTLFWLSSVSRRRLWRFLKERKRLASYQNKQEMYGTGIRNIVDPATVELIASHYSVQSLLARLPVLTAETIFLYAVQDYRPREIAELHSCPVTTVKSRLKRGFRALRELLSEE